MDGGELGQLNRWISFRCSVVSSSMFGFYQGCGEFFSPFVSQDRGVYGLRPPADVIVDQPKRTPRLAGILWLSSLAFPPLEEPSSLAFLVLLGSLPCLLGLVNPMLYIPFQSDHTCEPRILPLNVAFRFSFY